LPILKNAHLHCPAASGTTEFLNCLPKQRTLKPYYYHKYELWHKVFVNSAQINLVRAALLLLLLDQCPVFLSLLCALCSCFVLMLCAYRGFWSPLAKHEA
jgi:hypothetical protein